ncbi:uncharacterized protein LOC105208389 [Zeugodacus cucurbitae]|uniref:uncharacterized protein LOC105208389 n=1 Tax=Zeugodacus cucurbitae TaxID=28588 RepID=UPI000596955D|nr:uncharacterized protein LOC105208389 [Zeugodacus cucurbitae]
MSLYNADELVAPLWMNTGFFEKVLRSCENDSSIEVINVSISPASMKGDHYASIMFRSKVEYLMGSKEFSLTKSVIVKTLPEEGNKHDMLSQSQLFETEINMYNVTLPKIAHILKIHGDPITLAPRILYCSLKPHKIIVLEDISEQGFEMMRNRFPTENEMKKIYRKLAKLHAVSYMMAQCEEYKNVTQYQCGICSSDSILEYEMFKSAIHNFIKLLTSQPEVDIYAPKFQAMESEVLRKCHELFCAHRNGIKTEALVLNHGDFHLKNLMFKFDENSQMQDFIMVDFQLSVYAPPIIDLTYSKYMMCSSLMRNNYNIYLRTYFEQFNQTLRAINYHGDYLKYCELKLSSLRHRHFSIFIISFFLPLLYTFLSLSPEELKDTDSSKIFSEVNDETGNIYQNPKLVAELRKLLPKLLYEGYLD